MILEPIPHPREQAGFIGHEKAVQFMQEALHSGRMPHAWLISGIKGIGKATLAYRAARYILAGMPQGDAGLFGDAAPPLFVPESHHTFSRIRACGHGDLMVLEAGGNSIKVEEARKIAPFLHMTPAETNHRVVIIDGADFLNTSAANAILKLLEEPPPQVVLFLVAESIGKVLPTIRSRCRSLKLRPMPPKQVEEVLAQVAPDMGYEQIRQILPLSEGSPGFALELTAMEGHALYEKIAGLLAQYPDLPPAEILSLADTLAQKEEGAIWQLAAHLLHGIWGRLVKAVALGRPVPGMPAVEREVFERFQMRCSLALLLQIWEKMQALLADTEAVNLDKRAVVVSMFEQMRTP